MTDKLQVLEQYFTHGYWMQTHEGISRIMGLTIKAEPSGYLAVVKAFSSEGPVVAFIGAPNLEGIYRKLAGAKGNGGLQWREDKYYLDKNG